MPLQRADFPSEIAYIEYCACRRVWPIRNQIAPTSKLPWADWYHQRFGRSISEAVAEYREKQDASGVHKSPVS